MKRNVKFFMTVTALLLLSAVILTGCMYVIAADNGATKPYDPEQRQETSDGGVTQPGEKNPGNSIVEDAPTGQLPLQNKFNEYLHEDGNTVTIFSPEQYAQLKAVRDSGERTPLTYEEILFLVNDSINMYFKYDEICLYNAYSDGVLPLVLTFSAPQSSSSFIIKPYHGDFSEFEIYSEASVRYQHMLQEIYDIIYYRIYMHDAGFTGVRRYSDTVVDPSEWDAFWEATQYLNSVSLHMYYQMLAIDGSTVGGTENGDKLADEFRKVVEWERMEKADPIIDYEHYPYLDSAILYTDVFNLFRYSPECKFYIAGPKDDPVRQIYPTAELEKKKPQQAVIYQAIVAEDSMAPIFHLDYGSGRAVMSASVYHSFAMVGTFDKNDQVLKLSFDQSSYVFFEHEDGYVYSAENSQPKTTGGFDFADGLVFKKYEEYVAVQPDPDPRPPVNNETDPDEDDERWAYLKYDSNDNYCTLMSPDGNCVLEGSYAKEDDKLVFMFRTAEGVYTYCFQYRGGVVYTYSNDLSSPAPGYRFGDGMEYYLTVFDDGICFLEAEAQAPTDVHAEEFERYYPDELYDIYVLSHLVSWEDILAGEVEQKENESFYNEQLPPLYLMIRHFDISKEAFLSVADQLSKEQIDWLFSGADEKAIMENLKAEWAVYYDDRLYNVYELAELDKDLVIELRENGVFDELIAYMDSLGVESEALTFIKDAGR